MKMHNKRYKILTLLFLCLVSLQAQEFAERSVYQGSYQASNDMTLEVSNKYGNIQILNWDKDSVQITTEVYLSSSTLKKLEKLKQSVKIKYDATEHHIFAQTIFGNNSVQLINELQSFTQSITPGASKKIDINYKIYVPQGINLKVKNQYGDIYLDDMVKDVEIIQSNGTLRTNTLKGNVDLNLRFVKASVHQINDGDIDMYYSSLDLEKAISINCESRSSEIYADHIEVLKLRSSRDEIRLREIGYLYGTASYPKLKIDFLMNELDCDLSYGDLIIQNIDASSTILNIRSERTDIEINTPKTLGYSYEFIYNESCTVMLPYKIDTKASIYNGEVVKKATGNTGEPNKLNIVIKALKRCHIKMRYHINS